MKILKSYHIYPIFKINHLKEEYAAFKERVLTKLERMGLTDLRAHIIYEDIWTPEDIQHNYRSNRGAIYGVVADKKKKKGLNFLSKVSTLTISSLWEAL